MLHSTAQGSPWGAVIERSTVMTTVIVARALADHLPFGATAL